MKHKILELFKDKKKTNVIIIALIVIVIIQAVKSRKRDSAFTNEQMVTLEDDGFVFSPEDIPENTQPSADEEQAESEEEIIEEEAIEVEETAVEEVAVEEAAVTEDVLMEYPVDEFYMEDMYFEEMPQNTYFKVMQLDLEGNLLTEFEILIPQDAGIHNVCALFVFKDGEILAGTLFFHQCVLIAAGLGAGTPVGVPAGHVVA